MLVALLIIVVLGLIAVLLSFENDSLKKRSVEERRAEEDRMYKLSVIKDLQGKIAYMTDPEEIVETIMISLRNFFSYSAAASMAVEDAHVVLKIHIVENIGSEYVKKVREVMLSSFGKLVGKLPLEIETEVYGRPIDDTAKSIYSSSFHVPLIATNKVLALIHLSSSKVNAYPDMEDLHEIIDAASSSLTNFGRAVDRETEKFSSLISSIDYGIFMADSKNNLYIINDSAKKLLGLADNVNFFDVANVFSQNLNLQDKIGEVILNKKPYSEREIQVNDKILNILIKPVGNYKVSVVLTDMTDYKKKETLKEDLIHIMVHELRAPVTTIKDSAELIITTKDTLEESKKIKFLEIIHSQAKKVLGQIGSILDTAKLDAGKLVLQKTKGAIAKLIKDEIQTFMPQAERKKISLSFNVLAKSVPEISFDEIRISQVIDNLLSNSLKFTPENGAIKVELDYKAIPPILDGISPMGEFLSLNKYIIVSVSDNGAGIAPEQQKLLFSKYAQAKDAPEKISTLGTGLGLYLVKGIVQSHEGRIWVKSAPGKGSTFSFALPATDTAKTLFETSKVNPSSLSKPSQTIN